MKRERRRRFNINWGWIVFVVLYVGLGTACLWGILDLLEGR